MKLSLTFAFVAFGLFAATSLRGNTDTENSSVIELEAFIVQETAETNHDSLYSGSQEADGFFQSGVRLLEIPRSVSVLTESGLKTLGIRDYDALDQFGAGTQRVNYFGLAGSAFLRGARAGTYFDGILRLYQRNEMPMSFGAFESIELVRGPVPSGFSPTLVGGYLNQIPKSPFFDTSRGSVELDYGSWDTVRWSVDYGGPFLLGDHPAAFRVSIEGERSDRFYANTPQEMDSIYLSLKTRLNKRQRLFVAGEYYRYRSSEIPGINRPTQELIDSGDYLIGEPALITDPAWGGTANRTLLEFPFTLTTQPALQALAIPGEVGRSSFSPELLSTMLWLGNPQTVAEVYSPLAVANVPPPFQGLVSITADILGSLAKPKQDVYVYTPEFFAAGGKALTAKLPRNRVLADEQDFADAEDFLLYLNLDTRIDGDRSWTVKAFFEGMETDKASTYGFAIQTKQWVGHLQGELQDRLDFAETEYHLGVDLRYSEAKTLQDFDAEPFSRRDLSRDTISANSVVLAGSQLDPDGLNLWSSFGGASQKSHLGQAAIYLESLSQLSEAFSLYWGGRVEKAFWETQLPAAVAEASTDQVAASLDRHDETLFQLHLNPIYKLSENQRIYGALQYGKALAPGDGGTIGGQDSFTDVEMIEAGWKGQFLDERLSLSASVYEWKQSTYSNRDAAARPLKGKGIEVEGAWTVIEQWMLFGAFTAQRVTLEEELLGFGALAFTEEDWALYGGLLNGVGGREAINNPEMVFAGYPEISANLYSLFTPIEGVEWLLGIVWKDNYWHNMERTLRIPSSVVWNTSLRWDIGPWSLGLRVDNLFDQDYWIGQEPIFSANTLITPAPGRSWTIETEYRF